jgi:hypothetical protein
MPAEAAAGQSLARLTQQTNDVTQLFCLAYIKTMTLHLSPEELCIRHKAQQKAWREANPDLIKAYHRKYHAKSDVKERRARYGVENKDRINTRRREIYRERHPPKKRQDGCVDIAQELSPQV